MNRIKIIIIALAVVLIPVGLLVFFSGNKDEDGKNRGPLKKAKAEVRDVLDVVKLRGPIISANKVSIYSEAGGKVMKVMVEKGAPVKAGDLLLKIDEALIQTQLDRQRMQLQKTDISYNNLKEDFGRKQALYDEKLISASQFKEAETAIKLAELDYKMAQRDLEAVEEQLQKITITSPISGVVTDMSIQEGEIVAKASDGSSKALMTITNVDEKSIEIYVNDVERSFLKLGMPVTFWLDSEPKARDEGRISKIDEAATKADTANQFRAQIQITDNEGKFTLGANANIEIVVKTSLNVLAVPVEAVFRDGNESYCFVAKRGMSSEKRPVQTGTSSSDFVEIKSGLKAGEEVYLEEPTS